MIDPTEHLQRQWEDMDPATAEINRISDENATLREIISDLILGARRSRVLISRKSRPETLIATQVTKGQVMRAIRATK